MRTVSDTAALRTKSHAVLAGRARQLFTSVGLCAPPAAPPRPVLRRSTSLETTAARSPAQAPTPAPTPAPAPAPVPVPLLVPYVSLCAVDTVTDEETEDDKLRAVATQLRHIVERRTACAAGGGGASAAAADTAAAVAGLCGELVPGGANAVYLPLIRHGHHAHFAARGQGFRAGWCGNRLHCGRRDATGRHAGEAGVPIAHFYVNAGEEQGQNSLYVNGKSEHDLLMGRAGEDLCRFLGQRTSFRAGAGIFCMHVGGYRKMPQWHGHIFCDMRAVLHGVRRDGAAPGAEAASLLAHAAAFAAPAVLDQALMRAEPRTLFRLQTNDGKPSSLGDGEEVVLCREHDGYHLTVASKTQKYAWRPAKEKCPWYLCFEPHAHCRSAVGKTACGLSWDSNVSGHTTQSWVAHAGTGRHEGCWVFESASFPETFLCPDRLGGNSLLYFGHHLYHKDEGCLLDQTGALPDQC